MSKERIFLTRETLYEQVWTEPTVRVARRLGLSGRGLGKLCARYQIPVPPRGWWASKQHGYAVRRIPLPPGAGTQVQIVFHSGDVQPSHREAPEVEREKDPAWVISVPDDLAITHPLVKQAAAAVRKASREARKNDVVRWQGRYQAKLLKPTPGNLDIAVSRSSLARALRIMQALLAAFDRRGFTVRITDKNETYVTVLDEPFQIALIERLRHVTVKHSYGSRVDLEPSGRLILRIGGSYQNSGSSDSESRRLEDLLNRFIVNLVRRALEARRARVLHAERQERWVIQDEKNRLAQQQRDSETLRRRRLRTAAIRWARHQRNVEFVNAVEGRLRDGHVGPDERESAFRWLSWASERLKAVDPIDELLKDAWPSAPLRAPSAMPWGWD